MTSPDPSPELESAIAEYNSGPANAPRAPKVASVIGALVLFIVLPLLWFAINRFKAHLDADSVPAYKILIITIAAILIFWPLVQIQDRRAAFADFLAKAIPLAIPQLQTVSVTQYPTDDIDPDWPMPSPGWTYKSPALQTSISGTVNTMTFKLHVVFWRDRVSKTRSGTEALLLETSRFRDGLQPISGQENVKFWGLDKPSPKTRTESVESITASNGRIYRIDGSIGSSPEYRTVAAWLNRRSPAGTESGLMFAINSQRRIILLPNQRLDLHDVAIRLPIDFQRDLAPIFQTIERCLTDAMLLEEALAE